MFADVAGTRGAEDRIRDRMAHDVGIRVTQRAKFCRHLDAANHQSSAGYQTVQVVADADPSRLALGQTSGRGLQILRRRDLHVRGRSIHDPHAVAGLLGEHGFVCRLHAGASERNGITKHAVSESLRRLRQIQRLPRDRIRDHGMAVPLLGALHRVADRYCGDGCSMRRRSFDDTRDDLRRHERPGGIVHEHDVRGRIDQVEAVRHRILPPHTAGRYTHLPPRRQPRRRRRRQIWRQYDNGLGNGRMAVERLDAALQNRAAVELEQLLRPIGAEPCPNAARRNDGGHAHGRCLVLGSKRRL